MPDKRQLLLGAASVEYVSFLKALVLRAHYAAWTIEQRTETERMQDETKRDEAYARLTSTIALMNNRSGAP